MFRKDLSAHLRVSKCNFSSSKVEHEISKSSRLERLMEPISSSKHVLFIFTDCLHAFIFENFILLSFAGTSCCLTIRASRLFSHCVITSFLSFFYFLFFENEVIFSLFSTLCDIYSSFSLYSFRIILFIFNSKSGRFFTSIEEHFFKAYLYPHALPQHFAARMVLSLRYHFHSGLAGPRRKHSPIWLQWLAPSISILRSFLTLGNSLFGMFPCFPL